MKKFYSIFALLIAAVGIVSMSSCCKNDGFDVSDDGNVNQENQIVAKNVITEEQYNNLSKHMTIYNGTTPPTINGTYLVDPMAAVYCSDNVYQEGYEVVPDYIKFSNQNNRKLTLDFVEQEGTLTYSEAEGVFISGSGNNFSVFFNTVGTALGISTKTALVISGTKTSEGIKNLEYAFVMVEKGDDPENKLMAVDAYRVFKDGDGLAANATHEFVNPSASKGVLAPATNEKYVFSMFK